jgi:hypothetical protein
MSLFRPGKSQFSEYYFHILLANYTVRTRWKKYWVGNSVPYLIPARVFNQNIIFECIQLRGTMA